MRFKGLVWGVLVWTLALGLVGCAPLPGRTLDPMAPALGFSTGGRGLAADEWTGWYRDSREEGEISLILTWERNTLQGVWQLRAGGSGKFAGTLAADGRSLFFFMERGDRECYGAFAGRAEYVDGRISGTYRGTDCLGAVEGGSLELNKRGSQ